VCTCRRNVHGLTAFTGSAGERSTEPTLTAATDVVEALLDGLRHIFTCRKLEAMCSGSDPVRKFSLTRALARNGITAKTEMSPVSWFWLRSRFCSITKHGLVSRLNPVRSCCADVQQPQCVARFASLVVHGPAACVSTPSPPHKYLVTRQSQTCTLWQNNALNSCEKPSEHWWSWCVYISAMRRVNVH